MKAVMNVLSAFQSKLFSRNAIFMLDSASAVVYLNKLAGVGVGKCVKVSVSVDTSDLTLNKVTGCEASSDANSEQEECHRRLARLAWSDCADRVVFPS